MDQSLFAKKQNKADRAVIYIRVSSEEQIENYSLATQEDICKKEAARRKLAIDQIFREEGKSAKTIAGRPVLLQMLEYCRKHKKEIGAVIVYRLDRISRQTADYLVIRKKLADCEVGLISASEPTGNSPTEKFVETMLAGFAQMDNDVRSERSRNGLKARFMSGLNHGYVPIGYVNQNGYAIKDPELFPVIKEAWDLMATGTKTLNDMADMLNKKGIKITRNKDKAYPIRPQVVSRIFKNKFYAGKITSKKYNQEVDGQHPPMITEEQYYKVQAIIDGRNTNISTPLAKRNKDNPDFPLRRIVKCQKCGASITGAWSKGKLKKYGYYFCRNRCNGSKSNIPVDVLESATLNKLCEVALKDQTVDLFNAYLRKKYYERIATLQKRRDEADVELNKLYDFRQGLIEKNITGTYSDEMFKEQNKLIEDKIKALQVAKNDDLLDKYNLEAITKFVKNKLGNLTQTYIDSSLEQKRTLLCSIYPSGMHWGENGYSNTEISKFYTCILDIQLSSIPFGSATGTRTRVTTLKAWCPNP